MNYSYNQDNSTDGDRKNRCSRLIRPLNQTTLTHEHGHEALIIFAPTLLHLFSRDPVLAQLTFINGPSPGLTIELSSEKPEWHIGRGADCEIRLETEQASRVHAKLVLTADDATGAPHWMIEDCNSLNGTLINSRPLQRSFSIGRGSHTLGRLGDGILRGYRRRHDAPAGSSWRPKHEFDAF